MERSISTSRSCDERNRHNDGNAVDGPNTAGLVQVKLSSRGEMIGTGGRRSFHAWGKLRSDAQGVGGALQGRAVWKSGEGSVQKVCVV